jgi:hypothetical protein
VLDDERVYAGLIRTNDHHSVRPGRQTTLDRMRQPRAEVALVLRLGCHGVAKPVMRRRGGVTGRIADEPLAVRDALCFVDEAAHRSAVGRPTHRLVRVFWKLGKYHERAANAELIRME